MKSLLFLFLAFTPTLLFSQISIANHSDLRDQYIQEFYYYTDSLGVEMKTYDLYIENIDSLVSVDARLNRLNLDDDKKGFFLLCRDDDRLVIVKSYHITYRFANVYRTVVAKRGKDVVRFKVRGVVKINGVNIFVDNKTPKQFFKKIKKVSPFVNGDTLPNFAPFSEERTAYEKSLSKPAIVAIIDL